MEDKVPSRNSSKARNRRDGRHLGDKTAFQETRTTIITWRKVRYTEVKCYIQAVREEGGVVTPSITMAAATAIVRKHDRTLLKENGGPVIITKTRAKSTNGFCKEKGKLNGQDDSREL